MLVDVAKAPPYRFSGGGLWEAMHGDMAGIYEIRVRTKRHYRLFCVIDAHADNASRPYLVVIAGMDKANGEKFGAADYEAIIDLKDEYLSRNPRSLFLGV